MRKIKNICFLISILLFLFTSQSFCQEKSYLFSYGLKKGDTYIYKLTFKGEGKASFGKSTGWPFRVQTNILLNAKVTDVSEDGIISLQITPAQIKVAVKPQMEFKIPKEFKTITYTLIFTSQGRTLRSQGLSQFPTNSDAEVALRILGECSPFAELIFPRKEIKIGDTWEQKVVRDERSPVLLKYKFEGFKKEKGEELAVLSSETSFPFSTLNIISAGDYNPVRGVVNGKMKYYFSQKRGTVVRYEAEGEVKLFALTTTSVNNKYEVQSLNVELRGNVKIEMQ